jgi:uncharacterized repeat protein (TIGR02543 family)
VIANTQLWYNALPTSGWADAKYMSAMGHSSSKSASNFKVSTCNHYTANVNLGDWGFNSGNAQMLTPASGSNNAKLELTYVGNSYSSMNKTITVKAKVSTNDGATYSEATSPGTLSASSFAFTSYTSCKSAKSLSSGKITCGYTANTTLTAADADGYTFDGWYNASGTKQTADKTLAINPTADATYYAYYTRKALAEETHDVTISYMCGSTSIKENKTETGVGISTPSEISAPAIDGYKFDSWSFGTGVQSTDAETANPIDITTKTSGIYTLTANYSELPKETVYFINTPKWTSVNAYAYNSENTSWPGVAATKEAEKIGEHEVYSYTAIQGKHKNVIFNGSGGQTADLTWTSGKYYIHNYGDKTGWYTKEDAEALLVVPVVTHDIVVKAVAPEVWNNGTISIHYWGDGISATEKPVATEKEGNWNKYTIKNVPEGTSVNVIFVNGADWTNNANQTANITGITEDKCFQISAKNKDSEGKCTATVVECGATIEPEGSNSLTFNVTVPAGTEACYICGEWDWSSFKEMTKVDATHYTLKVAGAEKTHKYKYACQASWDYVEKKADGNELDGDRTWTANDVVAKWGKPDTYTIAGTPATVFGKEWDATYTANDMKLQEDGTFVWSVTGLELTKTTNVAFKIVKNQNWETAWPAENKTIPVAEDGTYNLTIYFNAAEKDDATKNNGIYISLEKQAVVTPETYTRTVTAGHYGTICLPYASSSYSGAEFYEVSWLKKSGETPVNLYLDQLAAGTQLVAGKPYIFRATSTELTVTYTGTAVSAPIPADENNGLTGSFDAIPAGSVLTGNYVVAQTKFWTATATAYAAANRAYIDASVVPTSEQAKIPGRRRVSLGAAGENAETGIDNIITTDAPVKVIENGQLIIIRNGEKFNVQGQKL